MSERHWPSTPDPINHPPHYARAAEHPSGVECIEMVRHMPFCLGNAIKYLYRAGHKGSAAEDYRKAAWYLRRQAGDPAQPEMLPFPRDASDALRQWATSPMAAERQVMCLVVIALGTEAPSQVGTYLTKAADLCEQLAGEVTP